MEIVPIEVFGLHVDIQFPHPLPYVAARLDEFAAQLCNPQTGLPMRAEQIRLRRFDELFDYELKANFFSDNGNLIRTAERVKMGIRNARTQNDWNVIHQACTRFFTFMNFDAKTQTHLSAHAHGKFDSVEERDAWLVQFSDNALITKPGALGYVKIPDWDREVRVLIEPSNVVPAAVFCAFDTQFINNQDWDSFLGSLPSVMENSVNYFELGFEPFKERV